jgi:GNAT superfamily N-acetyltransferase
MAVHPDHRSRGVGSLLMEVGILHADDLALECWMESSAMGKPLYEKFGFQSLMKFDFDTGKQKASDEWRKCAHEMTPPPLLAMWRPKYGGWKEDDERNSTMPWNLGVE